MRTAKVELLRAFALWTLFLVSVGFVVAAILAPSWQYLVCAVVVFVSMVVAWVATD